MSSLNSKRKSRNTNLRRSAGEMPAASLVYLEDKCWVSAISPKVSLIPKRQRRRRGVLLSHNLFPFPRARKAASDQINSSPPLLPTSSITLRTSSSSNMGPMPSHRAIFFSLSQTSPMSTAPER